MKSRPVHPIILALSLVVTCGLILPARSIPHALASPRLLYTWQEEAENGVLSGDMQIGFFGDVECHDDPLGGGQYIYCPNDWLGDFNPASPVLALTFSVPTNDNYYICAHVLRRADLNHNSFRVSIDNAPYPPFWYEIPVFPPDSIGWCDWGWDLVHDQRGPQTTYYLTAGQHTLRFYAREAEAGLDMVLVTNDPSQLPDPVGPISPAATYTPTPTPSTTPTRTPAPLYLPLAMRHPAPTPSPTLMPTPLPVELSHDDGSREQWVGGRQGSFMAVRYVISPAARVIGVRYFLGGKELRPARFVVWDGAWHELYSQTVTAPVTEDGGWGTWPVPVEAMGPQTVVYVGYECLSDYSSKGPWSGWDTDQPDGATYAGPWPPAQRTDGDAMIRVLVR